MKMHMAEASLRANTISSHHSATATREQAPEQALPLAPGRRQGDEIGHAEDAEDDIAGHRRGPRREPADAGCSLAQHDQEHRWEDQAPPAGAP